MVQQLLSGQSLLIGAARSHSVGLLWTSDQPDADTCTRQHPTQQTAMPPAGFEPTILSGERPETYALDSAVTGIGVRSHKRYTVT